jgi:hypothetical protein
MSGVISDLSRRIELPPARPLVPPTNVTSPTFTLVEW